MEGESSTCTYDELENIILNGSSGPCSLPLEYLRRITNNFSDERLLGEGGFSMVYKGVLQNGKIVAVKRLHQLLKPGVERQFENEVYHLMRLKHPNIVRFLGYCYETRNECVEHDGRYIFAEMQQKLICLEYLPHGSLDRHLSDESSGHEWHTRYKIIKGICCGLLYLHEECQSQFGASIIHLDLKPGNILLDEYMGPKITDFGLSRLFEDNKTQIATFLAGSRGYMAPEYLIRRIVTAKADIYNLGVIIVEIITGTKVDIFSFSSPTSCQEFVDGVIKNWRNRLEGAPSETDCKQIKCCLEIGLSCIKVNREERPTSREIIERLDRWQTTNCNVTHMEEKQPVSTAGYFIIKHSVMQPRRPPKEEFTFAQLEAATKGFSLESMIGEGSFGTVYRGYLPDGREVAIKRGESGSGPRDDRQFKWEVGFLSNPRHKHLVDLIGYCAENDERLLVCEYMRNGALYGHLHPKAAPSESLPSLVMSSWKLRIRILLDASRGIDYVHSCGSIHRDIKSSIILLDASWRARLSCFGLSLPERQAQRLVHRTVKVDGTVGYMDPEYNSLQHFTVKSDVYSFGVVMLEMLTGKRAILESEGASPLSVVDYAVPSIVSAELSKVLDPRVPEPAAHEAEALGLVAYIAVHCVRLQGKDRPAMAGIVANLETAFALCEGSFDGDLVKSPSSDSLPGMTPITGGVEAPSPSLLALLEAAMHISPK